MSGPGWAALLLAMVAFFPLSAATQQWPVPPDTISTPNVNASEPAVAADPNGNMIAVWIENAIVVSKTGTIGGGWNSMLETVSGSGASLPVVKMDGSGNATALWLENGVVKSASLPLNGNWSASTALSGAGATTPQLAIDSGGDLVAVWVEGGFIKSATQLAGGSWPVTPDTISSSGASSPAVAIGAGGAVFAVWNEGAAGIKAATKSITGSWGVEAAVSEATSNVASPQVAVYSNGNAVAIWYQYDLTGSIYSNVGIQTSVFNAGMMSWSTPELISTPGLMAPNNLRANILISDLLGESFAIWSNSPDGQTYLTCWNYTTSGTWNTRSLVAASLYSNQLSSQIDGFGTVFAAWVVLDPSSGNLMIQGGCNQFSYLFPGFNTVWILPPDGQNASPVTALGSGVSTTWGVVAWNHYDGTVSSIQALSNPFTMVAPPTGLSISSQVDDFVVYQDLTYTLSWQPSSTSDVLGYTILRNGNQMGWVNNTTTEITDHNRISGQSVTYSVYATDIYGRCSTIATTTFPSP